MWLIFFFFSSRRRHTRFDCDWSSDVCSSDLLSADFRIKDAKIYKEFYGDDHPAPDLLGESVYGLPEIYRAEISDATLVACPGCYPTSILLLLLPLIRERVLNLASILVTSLSGVTW